MQIAATGPANAVEAGFSAGVSWEHLNLPSTEFGVEKRTAPPNSRDTDRKIENHDGDLDGVRVDFGLGGLSLGGAVQAGIKGFYSWYESGAETQSCRTEGGAVGDRFCTVVPLFDPDPNGFNMPFSVTPQDVNFRTEREVYHWGVAVEFQSLNLRGGMKDAPVASPKSWKGGVAYRAIDQDLRVTAVSSNGPSPVSVTYTEDLDTDYLGGYIGFVRDLSTRSGVQLKVDGEAGLYWASTDYDGNYNVAAAQLAGGLVNQSLSLSKDELAVIAALKLSAEKDMGRYKLAGFVRGEYISYAPEMAYNDADQNGVLPNAGLNNRTSIDDDDAWTVSAGARVIVPLHRLEPVMRSFK